MPAIITYKQLLSMGHAAGLCNITTEIVQIPTDANGRVAIMRATVTLKKGPDDFHTYQGTGDADPNNVKADMVKCLIRMAETRAKARALRDAVNVGEAAAEEMADGDGEMAARTARTATGKRRCDHCPVSDARPGMHHQPGCPNRKEAVRA